MERLTRQLLDLLTDTGYPTAQVDCEGVIVANHFCGSISVTLWNSENYSPADRLDFHQVAGDAWASVLAVNQVLVRPTSS